MNKVILMGRLTRDPDIRYAQGDNPLAIARYTLAVDRRQTRNNSNNEQTADFINCVAFGRNGEFAERYLRKGTKIAIEGRIQTGSYLDNETGKRVYTTDIVVEGHEFCESKNSSSNSSSDNGYVGQHLGSAGDGFMNIPDGIDEELPFN